LIAKKLNEEGYLTPENHRFTNSHVYSIYQKGLKRMERVNRIDIVEFSDLEVRPYKSFKKYLKDFQTLKGEKVQYFSFRKHI
jgi:DNA-binding PadR family transcriptional regulator